jgi:hypothetical protein
MASRFPELYDLVAVTKDHTEYFGYVSDIDYDLRAPRIQVEFFYRTSVWFDLSEVRFATLETAKELSHD